MQKRNWMAMGVAALAMGLVANSAMAEERLLSSNFAREFRGEQVIDLGHELHLSGMRGMLNSVILIASTERGNGHVELVVDGYVLERKQVGTRLESIQFFVGRELWPRTRDVRFHFKGNFNLAFLGASVDEQFGGGYPDPRDPRHDPRDPRDPRNPRDPRPIPVPGPTRPQMVSDMEFNGMMRELQNRGFDSDKEMIVRQHANFWVNRLMTMHQLGAVLGQFRMDDGRLSAVRALRQIVLVDQMLMNTILSKFDFEHNREQARRILMR